MFTHRHRRSIAALPDAPHAARQDKPGGWAPGRAGRRLASAGVAIPLAVVVMAGGARAGVRPAADAVTGTRASLTAVAAIPGSSGAWAVGQSCPKAPEGCTPGKDEVLRESGGTWSQVAAPSPGGQAGLAAVSAASASDAWAVGSYDGGEKNLYLHWAGHAWKQVRGPGGFTLTGVAAVSPRDALAVGYVPSPARPVAVSLHWNGRSWAKVPAPGPGRNGDQLLAVTAIPGTAGAWATGSYLDPNSTAKTLTLRWTGTGWSRVASPPVATYGTQLAAVAAISAKNAWAVGQSGNELNADHPLILHWNGRAWSRQKLPSLGGNHVLYGVAATSSDVWAVGLGPCVGPSVNCPSRTLTMRLTGSGWKAVPGASVSSRRNQNTLAGVAITLGRAVWAVGDYFPAAYQEPIFALLEKHQGSRWVTR